MGRSIKDERTLNTSSLQQIKTWLSDCLTHHYHCRESWSLVSNQRSLPTRLLKISRVESDPTTHICLVAGIDLPHDSRYVTLSHRWGSTEMIRLTSETHDIFARAIPYETLPRTFQHAVTVTLLLGFEYLWIDSLCTFQDSRDDWVHESSFMGNVYAQGTLNIAATYAENGNGGLFYQSSNPATSPCLFRSSDEDTSPDYLCYHGKVWEREIENAPLGSRAWVVQERVLSPRVVHFGASQVFWECCQDRAAELLPPDFVNEDGELKKVARYPGFSDGRRSSRAWVYRHWNALVRKYSNCNLTVESDKLIACSGLARRTCDQLGVDRSHYVAGLWRANLGVDLLWYSEGTSMRVPGRAPTWSWASVNGAISHFDDRGTYGRTVLEYTSVLAVEVSHDGNPFGQIKGGQLRIQGPLAHWPLWDQGMEDETLQSQSTLKSFPTRSESHRLQVKWDDDKMEGEKERFAYFLLMKAQLLSGKPAQCSGLILHPTGTKRGRYQRAGAILNAEVTEFEAILSRARDASSLDEELYLDFVPGKGFTIDIE